LLAQLRHQGLIRPDPLYLGLDVAEDGALLNHLGVPSDFLYTIGPPRKGALWETTAVSEIRVQISELVRTLQVRRAASSLASHRHRREYAPVNQ
jgi:uncharacterized NAD(P)/FAD-binding protein YdhS